MEKSNTNIIKDFFLELDKVAKTDLGRIVLALSRKEEMVNVIELDMPYTREYKDAIHDCLNNNNCGSVSEIINSLGKKE